VATILSAQTRDVRVNRITPRLFRRFPTAISLARAGPLAVEALIRPLGFFRTKARTIIGASRALVERHGGEVPSTMEELLRLPGIGRKGANAILGVGFGIPGFPVDTHVRRVTNRLGLASSPDPAIVERQVCAVVMPADWTALSLRLILHGRQICHARQPRCEECVLTDFCPSSSTRGWPVAARRRLVLSLLGSRGSGDWTSTA
jgi:endonuclease-3